MLSRKTSLIVFVLLIAAAITSVMIYRSQAEATRQEQAFVADKARFAKVEAEMAEAYAAIVTAVGKPDIAYSGTGCGRTNIKFAEGALFCSVTYTFAYGEVGAVSAQEHAQKVKSTFSQNSKFTMYKKSSAKSLDTETDVQQNVRLAHNYSNELSCTTNIDFMTKRDEGRLSQISKEYLSLYQFRCTGQPAKAIYPLAE